MSLDSDSDRLSAGTATSSMGLFESLDVYPKLNDEFRVQTSTGGSPQNDFDSFSPLLHAFGGGAISAAGLTLMLFMFVGELASFMTVTVTLPQAHRRRKSQQRMMIYSLNAHRRSRIDSLWIHR